MDTVILKGSVTGSMSDEEFFRFCQDNPDLRIERNSNLEIVIMSPVSTLSGFHSAEVIRQLSNWSIEDGRGLAFDSSTGFTLPDRSVLSPDASWVSKEKWSLLSEEDKNRFAPICPEFIIEVRSKSDNISDLKKKMKLWIKNGSQLAWLIDPIEKTTLVYATDGSEKEIVGFDKKLVAEVPVKGFVLDLSLLKI